MGINRANISLLSITLAGTLAGVTACFDPAFREGVQCSEVQSCPPGMTCELSSNICYFSLPDAGVSPDAAARHGLVGEGTEWSPRHWQDSTYAGSCDAYRHPKIPYVYEGSTGDGEYIIQPTPGSELAQVYCDMTTNGGGWTRTVFWNREADPAAHTLASLQAQLINEIAELGDATISTMTDLSEQATYIQWADVDATHDALAYRHDIDVPNRGDLRLDVHYYGYSMERSGIWFYATANAASQDVLCRSDAEAQPNYSPAERALIPYACPLGIGSSESFTWDSVEQRALGATITSLHLRSLHHDLNADRSHLYRLIAWIR